MSLSGAQYKEIQDALLAAFDEADLRQMVRLELDVDLDTVAGGSDLEERTFNLIQWADHSGRTWELIEGACAENPHHPELQALKADAENWHLEPPEEGEEPYQGLAFFDEGDADRFFGREALTAELVHYSRDNRLLAVIGASGSGKSSVVRAGVVVALQDGALPGSDQWLTHIITPTAHPLKVLAAKLTQASESVTAQATLMDDMAKDARSLDLYASRLVAGRSGEQQRLLLVVDQFEELFTLCRDKEEQRRFVDNLLAAAVPDGVTTVILTLRADFYAHCAVFANLRTALEKDQRYIGAMADDELRAAIVKPAEHGGWVLEPGLVEAMLDDVADEPGALPLLSHALLETWKRRSGRTLTFAGYHAAGGVQGAIAHTADAVYGQFDGDEQAIARNIFLRLTELGEGVQDTRRRVPLQELISRTDAASTVERVLQKLQNERLVTTVWEYELGAEPDGEATEPTIYLDVTHEALIREWPALRDWLAEDREGLRIHRKLTDEAQVWEKLGRDPGALYRGLRLEQTAAWAEEHADDLNEEERAFLDASQALVEAQRLEQERIAREREEARQRQLEQAQAIAREADARTGAEKKSLNRARWALGAAVIALILAGTVGWFLLQQNLELRGARLLREAQEAREAREVEAAIEWFEAAAAADPTLGIDVAKEIRETLRYAAIQLVYEGEELAAQGDHEGAAEKFEAALDLKPPSDTPVYVLIPEGDFLMGSSDEDDLAGDNEKPQHTVSLDSYWILSTEVTNEQYGRCVEADACEPPNNERWKREGYAREPVTDVDWYQASDYAMWVGGRLPTEAEWERACRGLDGAIYPWGDDSPDPTRLNYAGGGLNGVVPVGNYRPGANSLHDMAGNVREWTGTLFESVYPYDADDGREDLEGSSARTMRGGSWRMSADDGRCAYRTFSDPTLKYRGVGFRVVRHETARED